MHLTNYAINKENPTFIFNLDNQRMDVGHKRSMTSVLKILDASRFTILDAIGAGARHPGALGQDPPGYSSDHHHRAAAACASISVLLA